MVWVAASARRSDYARAQRMLSVCRCRLASAPFSVVMCRLSGSAAKRRARLGLNDYPRMKRIGFRKPQSDAREKTRRSGRRLGAVRGYKKIIDMSFQDAKGKATAAAAAVAARIAAQQAQAAPGLSAAEESIADLHEKLTSANYGGTKAGLGASSADKDATAARGVAAMYNSL